MINLIRDSYALTTLPRLDSGMLHVCTTKSIILLAHVGLIYDMAILIRKLLSSARVCLLEFCN